jgi:predicted alpha/beta hydrolase family esterase
MAQPVLVVHGAGEPRKRGGKVYWEPLLGPALGRKYRVIAPRMPKPEEPSYQAWSSRIEALLKEHASPILVGHSLGASIILKYLAEAEHRPKLTGLFLAATPWWGSDFPEFALPKDSGERLRDLSPLYLYQSKDDPEIPLAHLDKYRRLLPQATVRLLDGRGHEFNQSEFPELVADIQAACA